MTERLMPVSLDHIFKEMDSLVYPDFIYLRFHVSSNQKVTLLHGDKF